LYFTTTPVWGSGYSAGLNSSTTRLTTRLVATDAPSPARIEPSVVETGPVRVTSSRASRRMNERPFGAKRAASESSGESSITTYFPFVPVSATAAAVLAWTRITVRPSTRKSAGDSFDPSISRSNSNAAATTFCPDPNTRVIAVASVTRGASAAWTEALSRRDAMTDIKNLSA